MSEERSTPAVPPPEVTQVSTHRVACDGPGGPLGHPRVWLEIGDRGWVECPYCDRRFVLSAHPHDENEYLNPAARAPEAH